MMCWPALIYFSRLFFFNDTATTEIYTLSLHDALPISLEPGKFADVIAVMGDPLQDVTVLEHVGFVMKGGQVVKDSLTGGDRKSTRLNSSHSQISYAVFCLKKKNCLRMV